LKTHPSNQKNHPAQEESARVTVPFENRRVELRSWRYLVKGARGFEVPVYFFGR